MGTPVWNAMGAAPTAARKWPGRVSRGLKFLVVCGLALAMSLVALFVAWLTEDRNVRAKDVRQELSNEAGGPQIYLGPTVLVPYTMPNKDPKQPETRGVYAFAAAAGTVDLAVQASERRRSLYRVPVFDTEIKLTSAFTAADLQAQVPDHAAMDWGSASIAVGVSNAGAAVSDATLQLGDAAMPLRRMLREDGSSEILSLDGQAGSRREITLLAAHAAGVNQRGAFVVTAMLHFRGAQSVTVLPHAQSTRVAMHGNWRDPGFEGAILPLQRSVSNSGFTASWSIPDTARSTGAAADLPKLQALYGQAMTTNLVEVADAYQSVERTLKYAPLFLGLVFLTYFLFEVTAERPVHPAQYVLVDVAQLIFYLLLLSFAERIGFDWGFLLGGSATVLLLGINAGWVFRSERQRWRALGVFSALYAMIYGLLRMEDNALLIGAVGSFCAIAAAMYFTRRIDWYGAGTQGAADVRPEVR